MATNYVLNGNFEEGSTATFTYIDSGNQDTLLPDWNWNGKVVLIKSLNASWGSPTALGSDHLLGIQNTPTDTNSYISQTITGLTAGTEYYLSFYYAKRNVVGTPILKITIDDGTETILYNDTVTNTTYYNVMYTYTPQDTTVILKFNNIATVDATVFIDVVNIFENKWEQLGSAIIGTVANDYIGGTIRLSANGLVMGVSSQINASSVKTGQVEVYKLVDSSWSLIGTFNGTVTNALLGRDFALDYDGTTIAIGDYNYNSNLGVVFVYNYDGTTWESKGTINGVNTNSNFGQAVAIDALGYTIAVAAPYEDISGTNKGIIRIYSYNGTTWVQKGSNLTGTVNNALGGELVKLNDNGNIVAIPSRLDGAGKAQIYEWNGSSWVQKGSTLVGDASGDNYGYDMGLSNDGLTIALGARNEGASGYVKVFNWDADTSDWVQLGITLTGINTSDYYGYSLAVNRDATYLIVGGITTVSSIGTTGAVMVYYWNGTLWDQIGNTLYGTTVNQRFGTSASMSDNGLIIAVSSLFYDSTKGSVDVYKWNDYTFPTYYHYPPLALTSDSVTLTNTYGTGPYSITSSGYYEIPNSYNPYLAFDASKDESGEPSVTTVGWHSLVDKYTAATGAFITGEGASSLGGYDGEWVKIKIPRGIILKKYKIYPRIAYITKKSPSTFYILGSTDNSSWSLIDSQTDLVWSLIENVQGEKIFYLDTNTTIYSYYAIVINKVGNDTETTERNSAQILEWELYSIGSELIVSPELQETTYNFHILDLVNITFSSLDYTIGLVHKSNSIDLVYLKNNNIPANTTYTELSDVLNSFEEFKTVTGTYNSETQTFTVNFGVDSTSENMILYDTINDDCSILSNTSTSFTSTFDLTVDSGKKKYYLEILDDNYTDEDKENFDATITKFKIDLNNKFLNRHNLVNKVVLKIKTIGTPSTSSYFTLSYFDNDVETQISNETIGNLGIDSAFNEYTFYLDTPIEISDNFYFEAIYTSGTTEDTICLKHGDTNDTMDFYKYNVSTTSYSLLDSVGLFFQVELENKFSLNNIKTLLNTSPNFNSLFGSVSKEEFKNNFNLLFLNYSLQLDNYILTQQPISLTTDFTNNIVLTNLTDLTSNLSITGVSTNFDNHQTILPWINQIEITETIPEISLVVNKSTIYSEGYNTHIIYLPIQEALFNYSGQTVKIILTILQYPTEEIFTFYMKKVIDDYQISTNSSTDFKNVGFSIVLTDSNNAENTLRINHIFNGSGGVQITDEGNLIGDPHITTIFGYKYHFNYLGYFRILDANDLIINGLSIKGTQRWKNKQYIRKILIKYQNKILIADLGFRGEKCYLERNDGFETKETQLKFHSDRKIHCFNRHCLKEFSTEEEVKEHLKNTKYRHKVLMPVRNQIEIKIGNILKLTISNINKFNFQPCRMRIKLLNELINAKGVIIDSIYANDCIKIDSLNDFKEINYQNLTSQIFDKTKVKSNLI